jgi:hypothetical protein
MTLIDNSKRIKNKKIRKQVIHNLYIQHNRDIDGHITDIYISGTIEDTLTNFTWKETEQGFLYWNSIYYNYECN